MGDKDIILARRSALVDRLTYIVTECRSAERNVEFIREYCADLVSQQNKLPNHTQFVTGYCDTVGKIDQLTKILLRFNCGVELARGNEGVCDVDPMPSEVNIKTEDGLKQEQEQRVSTCGEARLQRAAMGSSSSHATAGALKGASHTSEEHEKLKLRPYIVNCFDILEMKYSRGSSPTSFWLCYYSSDKLAALLKALELKFKKGTLESIDEALVEGQKVIGYNSNIFRGCILSVADGGAVVLDVDTGEIEYIHKKNLWKYDEACLSLVPQAMHCKLICDEVLCEYWDPSLSDLFRSALSDFILVVSVKDVSTGVPPSYLVEIDSHSDERMIHLCVNEWMNQYVIPNLSTLRDCSVTAEKEIILEKINPCLLYREGICSVPNGIQNGGSLREQFEWDMVFVYGDSPWSFYLRYKDIDGSKIAAIGNALKEKVDSGALKKLSDPKVGQYIVANMYVPFRAVVLKTELDENLMSVLDIDSSEVKVVSSENVWDVNESVMEMRPNCIHCELSGWPAACYWNGQLGQMFANVLSVGTLKVIFYCVDRNIRLHFVQITGQADDSVFNVNTWMHKYVLPMLGEAEIWERSGQDISVLLDSVDPVKVYK